MKEGRGRVQGSRGAQLAQLDLAGRDLVLPPEASASARQRYPRRSKVGHKAYPSDWGMGCQQEEGANVFKMKDSWYSDCVCLSRFSLGDD